MSISITALAYALPSKRLTNAELAERFGIQVMEKIASASGILERRISAENECASDMACLAAEKIFTECNYSPSDFDLLIFATQTPDYMMPTTACIIQDRLGLPKSCAAFDINLGCSQFIYALSTAKAWLDSGMATRALVLCGDTPSKLIHPLDRSAISIFGDAAAACVIEKSSKNNTDTFSFGTDGSGFDDIICHCSGMRNRPQPSDAEAQSDSDGNIRSRLNMHVNGFNIFSFAYRAVPQSVDEVLKKANLSIEDIDLFVFHQAGEMIVSSAARRLKIPAEKIYFKLHDIGNCGGASIPIALADAAQKGKLKSGMKVLLCAFGVGLSWGSCIIDWSEDFRKAFALADFSESPQKPQSQSAAD